MHESNRVTGLTTAATIWLSAAIGMGLGSGAYLLSLAATALALVVMRIFHWLERRIDALFEIRQYQVTTNCEKRKFEQLQAGLAGSGLQGSLSPHSKNQNRLVYFLTTSGPTKKQNKFLESLLEDTEITDIQW